ncbi:hypothetical protein [Streptomyces sp. NPDC006997]|uniref:hypothetical protein n=1 Tax=Streptomyces sp. NPDC006997 TaxID=3155356 RepID=UPI0033C2A3EE
MYNLAPAHAPWFEHLTDSVRALGEAAREWQLAAQAATVDHARADHHGLTDHEGRVTGLPPADAVGWQARPHHPRPHSVARRQLEKHYRDAMYAARHGYEDAARLYASGAAWAVRQVQDGHQPHQVEFATAQANGSTLLALVPGSERIDLKALTAARYAEAASVTAAFERLDRCLYAAQYAEDIDDQDYIADHEATQMHDALTVAAGIPDAAYDYGLALEGVLQFVLLGPKETHRRQRAEQRAAQERAEIDPVDDSDDLPDEDDDEQAEDPAALDPVGDTEDDHR